MFRKHCWLCFLLICLRLVSKHFHLLIGISRPYNFWKCSFLSGGKAALDRLFLINFMNQNQFGKLLVIVVNDCTAHKQDNIRVKLLCLFVNICSYCNVNIDTVVLLFNLPLHLISICGNIRSYRPLEHVMSWYFLNVLCRLQIYLEFIRYVILTSQLRLSKQYWDDFRIR